MTYVFLDCLLYSVQYTVHVLWSHPSACIRYKGLYGDPSAAIHHCRPGSALLSALIPPPLGTVSREYVVENLTKLKINYLDKHRWIENIS